jgi:hypothetical protein
VTGTPNRTPSRREILVPADEGIAPTRPRGHRILSPARLPVLPHRPKSSDEVLNCSSRNASATSQQACEAGAAHLRRSERTNIQPGFASPSDSSPDSFPVLKQYRNPERSRPSGIEGARRLRVDADLLRFFLDRAVSGAGIGNPRNERAVSTRSSSMITLNSNCAHSADGTIRLLILTNGIGFQWLN